MTEEEKMAISRLAIKVISHDKHGRKLYDIAGVGDSEKDARTALNYIIRVWGEETK